ncbi:MAG: hypothetical protein ABWY27_12330 [Telluria sp.]
MRAGDALPALSAAGAGAGAAVADGAIGAVASGLEQAVTQNANTSNIIEFRICSLNRFKVVP